MTRDSYEIQHTYTFLYQEGLRWGLCNRPAEPEGQLVDPEQYEADEPGLQFVEECWVVLDGEEELCSCQTQDQAETVKHTFERMRYMRGD